MPVVHDIRAVYPHAQIDWVVEPAFAPLVRRVQGVAEVIEFAQRRWRKAWWTAAVRAEWRTFKQRLKAQRYDAVIDLQGLTKSAVVARMAKGPSFGLANRTDGSGYEAPARWLVDQAIAVEPHIHALDRSRVLAAKALNYAVSGSPRFGLQARGERQAQAAVVFVHGTSRDDKLWPDSHWIELGRRMIDTGLRIALPHAGAEELARAQRIAQALAPRGESHVEVWPAMSLDALVDKLGAAHGVVGVDSGLSHIAVALNLPHVQLYNFPTAWRTGPLASHGHHHQLALEGQPVPEVAAVWSAWQTVSGSHPGEAAVAWR